MFKSGKCPKCEQVPATISIQGVDMPAPNGEIFRGVMYVCPNLKCHTILGASIDPIAIKSDILAKVATKR